MDKKRFEEFKTEHGKVYETAQEELKRFNIFRRNLLKIKILNSIDSATYGVNHLTDLSEEEFQERYTGLAKIDPNEVPKNVGFPEWLNQTAEVPKEIDWREKGAVTEVKVSRNSLPPKHRPAKFFWIKSLMANCNSYLHL